MEEFKSDVDPLVVYDADQKDSPLGGGDLRFLDVRRMRRDGKRLKVGHNK